MKKGVFVLTIICIVLLLVLVSANYDYHHYPKKYCYSDLNDCELECHEEQKQDLLECNRDYIELRHMCYEEKKGAYRECKLKYWKNKVIYKVCLSNATNIHIQCKQDSSIAKKQCKNDANDDLEQCLSHCDYVPMTPTIEILSPLNNSVIDVNNITIKFNWSNWIVDGKGNTHAHFHIDNVSGLSFSDHLMFYNSPDNVVELNFLSGPTLYATWIDSHTIQINNVTNGVYKIRAHLADAFHSVPSNSEADVTINVNVSA